jgi:hypothetical protein
MTDFPPPPQGDDAPDPAPYDAVEEAPPRGRRGLVVGSVAAVLAVVAGAAVYATSALSGGGRQPDELVPKATFAYLKVDLDPAAGQKLAARTFFGKFTALKGTGTDGDVFDDVLSQVVTGDQLDYARDVKPWFDKRAAVAAFPGGSGTEVVGVVRSKDDAKARAALDKANTDAKAAGDSGFAYSISKGYVVLSEQQGAVDDALRLSADASLRENRTYRDDVDRLDGDQIAVGWLDVKQTFDAGKDAVPFAGMLPPGIGNLLSGRLVAGLHLTGDYAEVTGLGVGLPAGTVPRTGAVTLLPNLPASTIAAVSVPRLGETLRTQLDSVKAPGFFDPAELLAQYLTPAGLKLREDVLPLFGAETVLAARTGDADGELHFGLVSKPDDASKAATVVPKAVDLLNGIGLDVASSVSDGLVYLADGDAYLGELKAGGDLGSSAAFKTAMGDLSNAGAAGYVDLAALLTRFPELAPKLAGLKALGVVGGARGDDAYFRLRLVAG